MAHTHSQSDAQTATTRCCEASLNSVRELLPEFVLECAELIGMAATQQLIKAIGGVDFNFPKGKEESQSKHILVDAVGADAAETLMQIYGGDKIYVQRCDAAFRQLRNMKFLHAIDVAVDGGMTQTAAIKKYAPKFDFTERWAYKVLQQQHRNDAAQMSLLDE